MLAVDTRDFVRAMARLAHVLAPTLAVTLAMAVAWSVAAWRARPVGPDSPVASVVSVAPDHAVVEWTSHAHPPAACTATYDRVIVGADGTAAHLDGAPSLPFRLLPDGRRVIRAYVPIPPGLDEPLEYRVVARVRCNVIQRALGGYVVEYPPVVIEGVS